MKVTPSNQTLILAGDNAPAGRPAMTVGQALGAVPTGAGLRQLTMVTAWPDSTVMYVRADYASQDIHPSSVVSIQPQASQPASSEPQSSPPQAPSPSTVSADAQSLVVSPPRADAARDLYGNPRVPFHKGSSSSSLRPEQQYAKIQSLLEASRAAYVDVHA